MMVLINFVKIVLINAKIVFQPLQIVLFVKEIELILHNAYVLPNIMMIM